jgi:hypothetical protein
VRGSEFDIRKARIYIVCAILTSRRCAFGALNACWVLEYLLTIVDNEQENCLTFVMNVKKVLVY